ncbi:MAG: hypothetical protein ABI835_16000 [Chloroflexota bacterium]
MAISIPGYGWRVKKPNTSQQQTVVVAQDVDYPGWTVKVDVHTSEVLSVGQMLGVVLPPGDTTHLIEFIYNPLTLKLGGLITILAAVATSIYLLRRPSPALQIQPQTALRLSPPVEPPVPASIPIIIVSDSPPSSVSVANPPIRILATSPVVHITVPPSDLPSQIEVTYPRRWRDYAGVASLVGVTLIAIYMLLSGRKPKR